MIELRVGVKLASLSTGMFSGQCVRSGGWSKGAPVQYWVTGAVTSGGVDEAFRLTGCWGRLCRRLLLQATTPPE